MSTSENTKEQQLQKQWISALRSGEYRQVTERLHDGEGFCCWGVLCDLVDPDGWTVETIGDWDKFTFWGPGEAIPPAWVAYSVGLVADDVFLLAAANDGGMTFDQIADMIERMPSSAYESAS